jgi:lipoate-protein ligase A
MQFIDKTFSSVPMNLAFEEAMLMEADAAADATPESDDQPVFECLRLWDAQSPFVVLGRGSKAAEEANLPACERDHIPVFRRVTGGATILAAPGCLFYCVQLSIRQRPFLQSIDEAHKFVMGRILQAMRSLRPDVDLNGICDLVIGDRKASGNALRVTRDHVLYHGTLLLDMDLDLVSRYLLHPPREPDYRGKRSHADFLVNLEVKRDSAARQLAQTWARSTQGGAAGNIATLPNNLSLSIESRAQKLSEDKYANPSWTFSR